MKRARSRSPEARARKYRATGISPDQRTAFAVAYRAVATLGVAKRDYLQNLGERGYPIDRGTFNRWLKRLDLDGSAVSADKGSGRPRALSDEQQRLLVGYVLAQNERNEEVHLSDVVAFVKNSFDLDITNRTALSYLNACGFSSQLTQNKTPGYKLSENELTKIACSWLRSTRDSGFFNVSRDALCSIDFTFTGHRGERRRTFSRKGHRQPKNAMAISTYTNCILTALWRDGKLWTPCMLFTKNPKFDLHRNSTKKRDAEDEHLRKMLKKFKIDYDRIKYVGAKGDSGTYVSESSEWVKTFFEHYDFVEGCHVLSDNGHAFAGDLTKLGFARHERYPAVVHHLLSPNDNRLHGEAKAEWRAERRDFSDDVESTLSLMRKMDMVATKHIRKWFDRNLMLNAPSITEEAALEIFGKRARKKSQWHADCLYEYRVWNGEDARGGVPYAPRGLEGRLDGRSWSQ